MWARLCGTMRIAKPSKEVAAANLRHECEGDRFKTQCQQGFSSVEFPLRLWLVYKYQQFMGVIYWLSARLLYMRKMLHDLN